MRITNNTPHLYYGGLGQQLVEENVANEKYVNTLENISDKVKEGMSAMDLRASEGENKDDEVHSSVAPDNAGAQTWHKEPAKLGSYLIRGSTF